MTKPRLVFAALVGLVVIGILLHDPATGPSHPYPVVFRMQVPAEMRADRARMLDRILELARAEDLRDPRVVRLSRDTFVQASLDDPTAGWSGSLASEPTRGWFTFEAATPPVGARAFTSRAQVRGALSDLFPWFAWRVLEMQTGDLGAVWRAYPVTDRGVMLIGASWTFVLDRQGRVRALFGAVTEPAGRVSEVETASPRRIEDRGFPWGKRRLVLPADGTRRFPSGDRFLPAGIVYKTPKDREVVVPAWVWLDERDGTPRLAAPATDPAPFNGGRNATKLW